MLECLHKTEATILVQVTKEIKHYNIDILLWFQTCWNIFGEFRTLNGETIIFRKLAK